MNPPSELQAKMQICDPEILKFIDALKLENKKLQKRVFQLEANNVSKDNKIDILKSEVFRYHKIEEDRIVDKDTPEKYKEWMDSLLKSEPNQSLQPTTTAVIPAAEQPVRQP